MTRKQQYVAWATGILSWTSILSILLSYWHFDYLDTATALQMMVTLLPLFVVALLLFAFFRDRVTKEHAREMPHKISREIHAPSYPSGSRV